MLARNTSYNGACDEPRRASGSIIRALVPKGRRGDRAGRRSEAPRVIPRCAGWLHNRGLLLMKTPGETDCTPPRRWQPQHSAHAVPRAYALRPPPSGVKARSVRWSGVGRFRVRPCSPDRRNRLPPSATMASREQDPGRYADQGTLLDGSQNREVRGSIPLLSGRHGTTSYPADVRSRGVSTAKPRQDRSLWPTRTQPTLPAAWRCLRLPRGGYQAGHARACSSGRRACRVAARRCGGRVRLAALSGSRWKPLRAYPGSLAQLACGVISVLVKVCTDHALRTLPRTARRRHV